MFKLKSITQLILVAFGMVAIPLFVAIVYSAQQLSKIDKQLNKTTIENTTISSESREIYNLLDSLERSSRQYIAVQDIEFLNTSKLITETVHTRLNTLESMSLGDDVNTITAKLKLLTTNIAQETLVSTEANTKQAAQERFSKIRFLNTTLNNFLREHTENSANTLANESGRIKKALLTISGLLIPCSIFSIAYFSRIINRPISQLRVGIERLGKQHLDNKISVSGPKNIELLGNRLEWLRVQLKELEAQKQQFLSHVSHELKTPLTAIREGTELMSEQVVGPLNEKQIEINDILKTNSRQLQSQIEDLLAYNKSIIDSDLSKRIEMPLDDLINEAIAEQKLSIKGRKITLKTSLKSITCKIDPEQMLVVFRNLLSNAIKFTPPGGDIRVSLKEKTSYAEFNIEDSGPGIQEKEKDQVFRAFYKGKNSSTGYMKGTGLGLAIVAQFVQFHKGEINLMDSSSGANFRIRLPKTN